MVFRQTFIQNPKKIMFRKSLMLLLSILLIVIGLTVIVQATELRGIPGDVNADGFVNIDDIFYILAHWGEDDSDADANEDGTVDIDDIFFVLGHWT